MFIGLSVFGSRNQAKDHGLRTVQRSCVPDPTSHTPPRPGERLGHSKRAYSVLISKIKLLSKMSVSFTLLPTMAAIIALVFTTSSSAPHAPSYGDPIPSAYAEKITVKRRCHSHPPAVATSSFSHAQMTAIPRPMRTSWPGAVSCLVGRQRT